jgi:hypothetical protein
VREYTDPTCDALLPELAPEVRGHVKTLVLDLEDVLVHKEWSRAKGWQVRHQAGWQVGGKDVEAGGGLVGGWGAWGDACFCMVCVCVGGGCIGRGRAG